MSDIVILLLLLSAAIPVALLFALALHKPYDPQVVIHIIQPAPPRFDAPAAPLQLLPEEDA